MNLKQFCSKYWNIREKVQPVEILYAFKIAHVGWEMDNDLWLVKLSDGSTQVFGTNHGGLCEVSKKELQQYLADAKERYENLALLMDSLILSGNW